MTLSYLIHPHVVPTLCSVKQLENLLSGMMVKYSLVLLYKNIRPQNAAIDHSEERKESMSFKDADDIELKLVAFGW